ncbi:hypothetical protein RN001_002931 [Aquatica leii]|uniref:Uncharacterized protein n=1 Tax=Aquatica leii TaxID=1421715 RepID=A0AAN7PE82_9COLE|nr:hypothetical protein RN001_002931 [Aquatica leii]
MSGRSAKYDYKELLKILFEHRLEVRNNVCSTSAVIWDEIRKKINGVMSKKAIYNFVPNNKHNCWNFLEILETDLRKNLIPCDTSSDDENQLHFTLIVNKEEWNMIAPLICFKPKLQPGWTDILNKKIKDKDYNCLWIFKNHHISTTGNTYLTINGFCKECKAELFVLNEQGPDEEGLSLSCSITNISTSKHTNCARQLRGLEREKVSQILLKGNLPVNYLRENANSNEKQNIRNLEVLRKCKQEALQKNINVGSSINTTRCPELNLQHLKYTQPYTNVIHSISLDKFFVHYWTYEQLNIYNSYITNHKDYSILNLDATGSLIQKLSRPYNRSSAHIFLYAGVVHLNKKHGQIPVVQMLSECQDTIHISLWLQCWIKNGAKPKKW